MDFFFHSISQGSVCVFLVSRDYGKQKADFRGSPWDFPKGSQTGHSSLGVCEVLGVAHLNLPPDL